MSAAEGGFPSSGRWGKTAARESERDTYGGRERQKRERERERKKEREERDIYAYLRRHSRECLTPGTRGLGRKGAKKIYHRRRVIHIHLELGIRC
mgnify:CR=1 FL=1